MSVPRYVPGSGVHSWDYTAVTADGLRALKSVVEMSRLAQETGQGHLTARQMRWYRSPSRRDQETRRDIRDIRDIYRRVTLRALGRAGARIRYLFRGTICPRPKNQPEQNGRSE